VNGSRYRAGMAAGSRLEANATMRELVGPTVVAALGAAALAAKGLIVPVSMFDAGINASAGTFILHGLVPYRDFWLLYGPLGGYLAALVGLVFPPNATIIQLVGLGLVASQSAAGYLLLRRLRVAPTAALLVAIVSTAASAALLDLEIWAWQGAVIVAFLALALALGAKAPRAHLAAGALVGVSVLFRQDVGLYALIALLITCRSARPLLGVGLVVGPVLLVLLAIVPVGRLYEQLVWYPIVGTRVYRSVPDALSQASGATAILLGVLFVWGARLIIAAAAVRAIAVRNSESFGLVVFALLCQLQTLGRGDFAHFAQAAGAAFLCLGTVATPRVVKSRLGSRALGSAIAMLAVVAAFAPPTTTGLAYQTSVESAVAYIQQNTSRQEPIFVGLTSNRFTFTNPLMVYYLADRAPGVRDTMYNPGITNRDATQQEMINDLDGSNTRYLVLDRFFSPTCEPVNASCQPGSTRLDEFIAAKFQEAADFGDIVVMVRR
jgi:hypothetical protein